MKNTFKAIGFGVFLSVSFISSLNASEYKSTFLKPKNESETQKITQKIINILLKHALTYDINARSAGILSASKQIKPLAGIQSLKEKVQKAVSQGEPIYMTLLGFPYKSQNSHVKCLGEHADYAERLSLEYLNNIFSQIKEVYQPGALLTIFAEGLVFCDIEGVEESTVLTYEKQVKQLAIDLPYIKIVSLGDLFPGKTTQEMREAIEECPPTQETLTEMLAQDKKMQADLEILSKRLEPEFASEKGKKLLEKHSLKEIVKALTLRLMKYKNFWKKKQIQETVPLSVSYYGDVSKKLGIKISERSYVTPWHGVAVEREDGIVDICYREDIDLKKHTLTTKIINNIECALFAPKTNS